MIPGSSNPLMMAAAPAGGYQVSRSLRFNRSDSGFCSRTPAVAGSRTTWTWAAWVKRSELGANFGPLFSTPTGGNDTTLFNLLFYEDTLYIAGSLTGWRRTSAVFRDSSAWYHILVSVDTNQTTANDRIRLYVNGTEVTAFSTLNNPSQGASLGINNTSLHTIGNYSTYFNGYMADIHFIDGQQLTPSSFTEVSATTGQLIPLAYSGTFGTNGFWLKFSDNSAATAATLGKDYSGNSNNWTPNNLLATQAIAAPFSVFGLSSNSTEPITNIGSLTQLATNVTRYSTVGVLNCVTADFGSVGSWVIYAQTFLNDPSFTGTIGISNNGTSWTSVSVGQNPFVFTGRYIQWARSGSGYGTQTLFSNLNDSDSLVDTPTSTGTDTGVGGEVRGNYATLNPLTRNSIYSLPSLSNGNLDAVASSSGSFATATFGVSNGKYYWEFTAGSNVSSGSTSRPASGFNSSNDVNSTSFAYRQNGATVGLTGSPTFATYQTGDTIGIALNVDSTEVSFYKNGSLQGSGAYTYSNTANIVFPGIFSADNNGSYSYNFGQRAFAYTAPSGFKALCDTNLPAPLVAKPNTLMDVALYTGNGSTQTISGLAFSPDLVWIKRRDSAANHALFDVVRGTGKFLESSSTNAEATSANSLTAFNSDGFSLGTYSQTNTNSATYATWAWDAGTSTVSNTAGSITSQVRANVSAGFSVVTYTGTGSAATVGHGLGVAPSLVLVKIRSQTGNWQGYHASLGKNYTIKLNTTDAQENIADYWGAGGVTSSVVGLIGGGYSTNVNGATHVAYCFAPVVGYSSFGSYTGNGSADGPFVYTGFRPRWIMIKNSSATANWLISDSARDPSNLVKNVLLPNLSNAEDTAADYVDFVSNGFKIKTAPSAAYNANGNTYVFVAFAENPFQYARAR